MKVKTFWLILLKIIGIMLVISGVSVLIQSLNVLLFNGYEAENFIWILASILLISVTYLFILWLFVFKTSWLVDKLHLEKGFEEERIDINVQLSAVLPVAVIVIGGIMFINSLPQLFMLILSFVRLPVVTSDNITSGWIIVYATEAILGYLLMTNSKPITRFILKHSHARHTNEDENNTK